MVSRSNCKDHISLFKDFGRRSCRVGVIDGVNKLTGDLLEKRSAPLLSEDSPPTWHPNIQRHRTAAPDTVFFFCFFFMKYEHLQQNIYMNVNKKTYCQYRAKYT